MSGERGALRSVLLLLRTAPDWIVTAWWGVFGARIGTPIEIVQAVIVREGAVLLARRRNLRGWELPGGNVNPGEPPEAALRREVLEETGLEVEVESLSGVYRRSGFLPHRACVYRCRMLGGALRPSDETPQLGWWPLGPRSLSRRSWWGCGRRAASARRLDRPACRRRRRRLRAARRPASRRSRTGRRSPGAPSGR